MSVSELPYHTRKRLPLIIDGLLAGKNYEQIAHDCGLKSPKTIQRDLERWRDRGGLESFLQNEWLRMHGKVKQLDPIEAHRQLTRLLGRTLTQKVKAEVEHGEIVVKMWQPPEKDKDSAASN